MIRTASLASCIGLTYQATPSSLDRFQKENLIRPHEPNTSSNLTLVLIMTMLHECMANMHPEKALHAVRRFDLIPLTLHTRCTA